MNEASISDRSFVFFSAFFALLMFISGGAEAQKSVSVTSSPLGKMAVERHTLSNGLRVVLSPERTVPTVAIAVYYDVGSRNEEKGRSGFAHLFEHMMFQGSANIDKGQHFELVLNRGGDMNGTTSQDRTNYYETLPSNEIKLGLWLEADRMRSLAITQSNFENQRAVVKDERRQRVDNQPYVPSMLRINELAYGDYWPYAHSTIGKMADLDAAPLDAVEAFFRSYYAPNNAVLTIAGDFEPKEAMQMVKKYFGNIPSRAVRPYDPPTFKAQKSEKYEKMLDKNAKLDAFHMTYHIPPSRTRDHYALEMMTMVLGHGESSRFYRRFVKAEELCVEISVGTDDRRGPDLMSIWAVLTKKAKAGVVREKIFEEFDKVAQKGITEDELKKAQAQLQSIFLFGLQTNIARAKQLASFELYWGNAELLRDELGHYLAVTNEDIKRVAQQYLKSQNRTVLDVIAPDDKKAEK